MAQRVFLIQMPRLQLQSAATAITGSAEKRRNIASQLAADDAPHLRRVAVSERVNFAAEQTGEQSEDWEYARNCMPYLLAARRADEMCGLLTTLDDLNDEAKLEEFFVEQAKKLGMSPRKLDRHKYRSPKIERVEKWIQTQLDQAASLREKALSSSGELTEETEPIADYAISTWVLLGRIFARTRPAFWQGRNRWLGRAAFPEAFGIDANVASVSSKGVQRLRTLLESTASAAPALSLPGWEKFLPKEGDGNLVSGYVRFERLDELASVLRELQSQKDLPYETGDEWVELTCAAAQMAKKSDSDLVEGDDAIYGAYRWPPMESIE
jgi:hypothetical protein